MSRSQPSNNAPSPVVRRFEWNGEAGNIRYYDKATKKNIDVALPFTYLLLDELATIGGYNEKANAGIYSNEVRDTRTDAFTVKLNKGNVLSEGLYKDIKDHVGKLGGQFVANCYIAFKQEDGVLEIGALKLKGAALGAWMEFKKANRAAIYEQAIVIGSYNEGRKGKVVFRTPSFSVRDVNADTKEIAFELDKQVQEWLKSYLGRYTASQQADDEDNYDGVDESEDDRVPVDDVPF
jgi:hypothetical protein